MEHIKLKLAVSIISNKYNLLFRYLMIAAAEVRYKGENTSFTAHKVELPYKEVFLCISQNTT